MKPNKGENENDSFPQNQPSQFDSIFFVLKEKYNQNRGDPWICIDISKQILFVLVEGRVRTSYPISSAREGIGNKAGRNKTPLGIHRIDEKIGNGAPIGMVFKAKRSTGQIAEILEDSVNTPQDFITTRILTLSGCELGINKGYGIDSYKRCIYIHGTQEEGLIGMPVSHGCIRMKNKDIITLFDQVEEGTIVNILNGFW